MSLAQNIRPANFSQISDGTGLGLTIKVNEHASSLLDCSGMPFDALRDNFGMLLGKPKNGICQDATTREEFMCHMDVNTAYKAREWPIFSTWVTAQILNARNSFLSGIISPILETPEINFRINTSSISAMPFTEIAPCGIPEEPSGSYTYSWKQTVRQFAQGCTVNRDLILDPNFGAQVWLNLLAQFVGNARLTIDIGIITTLVQTGYENISKAKTEGGPIDVHKLYLAESEGFFIMAVDPEQGIAQIRDLEPGIDIDTVIIGQGKTRYMRNVQGDSQTMFIQKLSTDPITNKVMVEFQEGTESFKTIQLGSRRINFIEYKPFYIGDPGCDGKGGVRINPLSTNYTLGQFYPPSPFIKLDGCNDRASCGNILATTIFQQSKTVGQFVDITLATRLQNSIYYDKKTGKVSRVAKDFARNQTQRRSGSPDLLPWDWNPSNTEYNNFADINVETTSNSDPDLTLLGCTTNIREMYSFRHEFVGLTFDPRDNQFKIPIRFGDFHLRSIPNDWIKLAGERLTTKFNAHHGSIEDGFMHLKRLAEAIRHSPWSDAYLFELLDKNVPRMITDDGRGNFRLVTVRTPLLRPGKKGTTNKNARDECKFPDADVIEEAKSNRFGGWDVPNKPASVTQDYPPGFASGVGIMTLAHEALKEGTSLWFKAGKEAAEAVAFAEQLLKFIKEFIGRTDLIDARLMPPWIHKPSAVAMLIDSIIKTAGPVHVGIPTDINFTGDARPEVPLAKVNLNDDTSILGATVAATRLFLEDAVRLNSARIEVNNETRALAILTNGTYQKMRGIDNLIASIGGGDATQSALFAALHQLYDFLIGLGNSAKSAESHAQNVDAGSLVANAFYEQLNTYPAVLATLPDDEARTNYTRDTLLKAVRVTVSNWKGAKTVQRLIESLRKERGPICPNPEIGYLEALRVYERPPVNGRSVNVRARTGGDPDAPNRTAPVYRADYTQAPSRHIRAPLASSQELRDYLRDKSYPWILPSDANLFYAYAEEPRIVTSDDTVEVNVHKNKFELCSLSRSHTFQCKLAAQKKNLNTDARQQRGSRMMVDGEDEDDDEDDLFSSLRTQKSQKGRGGTMDMKKIFAMGKNYMEDDHTEDPYYRSAAYGAKQRQPRLADGDLNSAMEDTYFGPWRARLAYLGGKEMSSLAVKFFFRAIIEAKNRLEVPVNLSGAGAVILDAIIARPFIEVTTSAMIALKAGSDTMITTIGHSFVQVTKESRGCWHIDAGFFLGVIKINPCNIVLIPHAFPETLRGGKNVTFMTNFAEQLRLPNPAKPSAISLLVGPDEREFESPMHITNGESVIRPGIDYALHLRKHSAGQWAEFMIGAGTVANIDIANMGRETYATCLNASNVLSQGPAMYIDPSTMTRKDVEGSGPMGSFIMNMPGVQDVYEGKAHRFPDRIQMQAYTNTVVTL